MKRQNGYPIKTKRQENKMNSDVRKNLEEYILSAREKHYRIAWSHVRNREDALDIIQESIYRALSYRGDLNPQHMETWFCTVLINTARDHLRKNSRITVMEEQELTREIEKTVETPSQSSFEDREILSSALEKLSEQERDIIILRYFENMELSEVAEITSRKLSTVKSTLYRSLRKLKAIIE